MTARCITSSPTIPGCDAAPSPRWTIPPLRYRRILVPALAWALALGRDSAIHAAYLAVILGFVFLGVYWLARAIESRGRHPAWGLMFVIMPASLVSMDRMTVDVALAALTAGFVLYSASHEQDGRCC